MEDHFQKSGRRAFLSTLGGIGMSTVGTPAIATKGSPKLPESAKEKLNDKYGGEATQIIRILEPLYTEYKKGKISKEDYHDSSTLAFLKQGNTPQLKSEILKTWRTMPASAKEENQLATKYTNGELSTNSKGWVKRSPTTESHTRISTGGNEPRELSQDVTTQSNTVRKKWSNAVGDKSTSGLGSAAYDSTSILHGEDRNNDGVMEQYEFLDEQKTKATVGVYGSAWAYMRFFDRFIPANSGDHKVQVKVRNMNGSGTTGSTTLSLYVEDSNGYSNTKPIDSITDTSGRTEKYYKKFDLDANKEYKIGFELQSTTQTGGGAGTSDYYSNNRGVHPNHTSDQWPDYYYKITTP